MTARCHYLWVDNFSKFLRRSIPTVDQGVFSTCAWTGAAIFPHHNLALDDSVKRNHDRDIIPAMPDNILINNRDVRDMIKATLAEGRNYYDVSTVKRLDVRNVPPKVDTKTYPIYRERVEASENSMDSVYPQSIVDINVGTNIGLATIMRKLYDDHRMGTPDECTRYLNMNVDENIYWRILKVWSVAVVRMFIVCFCSCYVLVVLDHALYIH